MGMDSELISSVPKGGTSVTKPVAQTTQRLAPMYRVIIHNDEVTPMDFVVHVLMRYFKKEAADAVYIMQEAHEKGVALVDVMGLEEAEFRVDQVHAFARTAKYPLTFSIEPA